MQSCVEQPLIHLAYSGKHQSSNLPHIEHICLHLTVYSSDITRYNRKEIPRKEFEDAGRRFLPRYYPIGKYRFGPIQHLNLRQ